MTLRSKCNLQNKELIKKQGKKERKTKSAMPT
jgi:hypothetical protein